LPERHKAFTRIEPLRAEMRDMVTGSGMIDMPLKRTSTQLKAGRLLDSWVSGDRRSLEHELRQECDSEPEDGSPEGEGREELLRCLVDQMREEADLFAPRTEKMHLGVWVDLLVHLAHPEVAEPAAD
jgi:hypothetical protein